MRGGAGWGAAGWHGVGEELAVVPPARGRGVGQAAAPSRISRTRECIAMHVRKALNVGLVCHSQCSLW